MDPRRMVEMSLKVPPYPRRPRVLCRYLAVTDLRSKMRPEVRFVPRPWGLQK